MSVLGLLVVAAAPLSFQLGSTPAALAEKHPEVKLSWPDVNTDRALSRVLLETDTLRAMNRLRVTPIDPRGALESKAFSKIAVGEHGGVSFVLVFGTDPQRGARSAVGPRLTHVILRLRCPISAKDAPLPDSKKRLAPLRSALATIEKSLGVSLSAVERDRYGNTFGWAASRGKTTVRASYEPERDQITAIHFVGRGRTWPDS